MHGGAAGPRTVLRRGIAAAVLATLVLATFVSVALLGLLVVRPAPAPAAEPPASPAAPPPGSPAPPGPTGATPSGEPGPSPAVAEVTVTASDDVFAAARTDIPVGGAVLFANRGAHAHTVTADQGGFDTGDLAPGDRLRVEFRTPGAYRYHCRHHGGAGGAGMSGLIVVGGADVPPAPAAPAPRPDGPATIRVPEDAPTVAEAAGKAQPGDLVLAGPGTWPESVVLTTPGVVLRGVDRAATIIDGGGTRDTGVLVAADGVAVENLTVRGFTTAGVVWWGVHGFRASHVTATANGRHGVRAFASTGGTFEQVAASGHADAGVSVVACGPCATRVTGSVVTGNAVGILVANARDVTVTGSEAAANGAGIVALPLPTSPRRGLSRVILAGNRVHGNAEDRTPGGAHAEWLPVAGAGIAVVGARDVEVERNRVDANGDYGILVAPATGAARRLARDVELVGNAAAGNPGGDLAVAAPAGPGICLDGNSHRSQRPSGIVASLACRSSVLRGGDAGVTAERLALVARASRPDGPADVTAAPTVATAAAPAALPSMADPAGRPAPVAAPPPYDAAAVALPAPGEDRPARAGGYVLGLDAREPLGLALGLYLQLLPVALYAAWVAVCIWDIARREGSGTGARIGLAAVVLGVPLLGPLAYLLLGARSLPAGLRVFLTVGGLALYGLIAAVAFSLGRA